MARKKSSDKKGVTHTQLRWLRGNWLLGSEPRSPEETMTALALMSGTGAAELWEAHGNPETHFWRKGMRSPISLTPDLEHHEACWLESGGEGDEYGGDSFFVWKYFSDDEKQKLWDDCGDKENFKWTPELRRPIPANADWNAAINTFAGSGLVPYDFPIE
jgi:hypothetical protein